MIVCAIDKTGVGGTALITVRDDMPRWQLATVFHHLPRDDTPFCRMGRVL